MKEVRGGKDFGDPFRMFGGPGGSTRRSPFDDPFFTRPFGMGDPFPTLPPSAPIIRELTSDDDDDIEEMENEGEEGQKGAVQNNEPFIDHPDDETDGSSENIKYRTDYNRVQGTQAQTFKVHSCKVTYGGIDGAYYSSSSTRRMGSDGVIMEECKEADKTRGEATHRISRGLHDKGHSMTRKLNADGKVETLQTLHNLNEDELGSFEDAWKGNTGMHQPPPTGTSGNQAVTMSGWGGLLLPSTRRMGDSWERRATNESRTDPSGGTNKKVIRIPIE